MYVLEVDRHTRLHRFVGQLCVVRVFEVDGFPEFFGFDGSGGFAATVEQRLVVTVKQFAPAIAFEDGAENPPVPVKVCELRACELTVKFRLARLIQKPLVRPQPAQTRSFRIAVEFLLFLVLRGRRLLGRIHHAPVRLIVPPSQPHVGGDHVRPRMHVTDHALR
jgi:hypothetical protein